jgi:hypothetical protein
VVNIFAREITDDLARLVKQIDTVVGKNQDKKMSAFLVILTDDPDAVEPQLVELAKKHDIQHVPLTIFEGVAGPPTYKISKDADVTVTMWVKQNVKVSHAFEKGGLNKEAIPKIVADTEKILE